jgi:hypothetical protein
MATGSGTQLGNRNLEQTYIDTRMFRHSYFRPLLVIVGLTLFSFATLFRNNTHYDHSIARQETKEAHLQTNASTRDNYFILANATAAVAVSPALSSSSSSSLSAPHPTLSQAPSPDPSEACHFEDGNGHFGTVNGTHSWNKWIHKSSRTFHNSSRTLREECSIIDHVQPLQHNQYNTSKPLAFLFIGDSLDYRIVRFLCKKNLGFRCLQRTEEDFSLPADLINHAKNAKGSSCSICTNDRVTFSHFKIFGMHHGCTNSGTMDMEESRATNTTGERIEKLLPVDVLSRLDIETNYVILVSSSLWDLSKGCNDQLGVTEGYQELYRQGIVEVHASIHKLLPNATVYWRTSPQVSRMYDNSITRQGGGRTRANQETLNALLRETVSENNLGTIVDWWAQSKRIPKKVRREQLRDGRHYGVESSLAFFNMYLNAVFDRDPSLLG